jgi:hypothetical protein
MPRLPNNNTRQGTIPGTAMNMPITAVSNINATTLGLVNSR